MTDSYLDEGFILDKKPGVNQPKRVENAKILIANTPMDADKIKIFGSKIQVDAISKVAELELAEKQKMKDKVDKILKHNCSVFINRLVADSILPLMCVCDIFCIKMYRLFSISNLNACSINFGIHYRRQ